MPERTGIKLNRIDMFLIRKNKKLKYIYGSYRQISNYIRAENEFVERSDSCRRQFRHVDVSRLAFCISRNRIRYKDVHERI